MSLLFHPRTLEVIARFKKYGRKEDLIISLSLILDNCMFVDVSFVHDMLFSYTSHSLDESLDAIIYKNFYRVKAQVGQDQPKCEKQNSTVEKDGVPYITSNNNSTASYEKHNYLENSTNTLSQSSANSQGYNFVDVIQDGLPLNHKYERTCKYPMDLYVCFFMNIESSRVKNIIKKNRERCPSVIGNMNNSNLLDNLELLSISDCTYFSESLYDNVSFFTSIAVHDNESIDEETPKLENSHSITSKSNINSLDSEIASNLNKENPPSSINLDSLPTSNLDASDSFMNISSRKRKKALKIAQSNTLNFNRLQTSYQPDIKKFEPLDFKHATFIYDKNNITLDTQRKRDDLVSPVQLQFIKHFDQVRPPIYQRRGEIKRIVYSNRKISEILSYDDDSSEDWEEAEETQTGSSSDEVEETESCSDGDDSWIEADSEEEVIETTRNNKKPSLFYKELQIQTYLNPTLFKNCSLTPTHLPSNELLVDIMKYVSQNNIDINEKKQLILSLFNIMNLPS